MLLKFVGNSSYDTVSGKAVLPSVVVGNQAFRVSLCTAGGLSFTVCEVEPTVGDVQEIGASVYNPTSGTLNIPVVKLQTADNTPTPGEISLNMQFEVEMRVFSLPNNQLGTEVTDAVPIW